MEWWRQPVINWQLSPWGVVWMNIMSQRVEAGLPVIILYQVPQGTTK